MNIKCIELILIKSNFMFFSRLSEGGKQFFINIHYLYISIHMLRIILEEVYL